MKEHGQIPPNDRSHPKFRWLRLAVVTAADLIVLVRFVPNWTELGTRAAAPHEWIRESGADGVSTSITLALLWLASGWLAVGLLFALASSLPGQPGRIAGTISRRALPRLLERIVVTAAGATLVLNPAAALADTTHPIPNGSIVMQLPTDKAGPPQTTEPQTKAPQAKEPTHATTVRVKPGDSLWLIAAQRLGPQANDGAVARLWPQVYAANRSTIGPEPGLVRPGQILNVPVVEAQP